MKQHEMMTVGYFLTAVVAIVVASVATTRAVIMQHHSQLLEDDRSREKKIHSSSSTCWKTQGAGLYYTEIYHRSTYSDETTDCLIKR
jgi:hypothetical protein